MVRKPDKPKKPKKEKKMAISWEIEITNVNLESKRGNVIATRTDTESALEPQVYTMTNTPLETAEDRTLVLNTIKDWVVARADNDAAIEAFIDNLEQMGMANLNTWELTR